MDFISSTINYYPLNFKTYIINYIKYPQILRNIIIIINIIKYHFYYNFIIIIK